MGCPNDDMLLAYMTKCLDTDEIQQVDLHIESCSSCRGVLLNWMRAEYKDAPRMLPENADYSEDSNNEEPIHDKLFQSFGELHPLTRGALVGRYVILEFLGIGGMGVVYAAFDPELERKVALKLLRPERFLGERASEARIRLLREAKAMAKVSHRNVVHVYDVVTIDGQIAIAMELINGCTLDDWLKAEERSWKEIREVFVQAARGLAAAHEAGLVHRDFKPTNVMVDAKGRVCVTDFGLVRHLDSDYDTNRKSKIAHDESIPEFLLSLENSLTNSNNVLGTPAYMAPEQLKGLKVDSRTDQYSFCVTMWEALFNERLCLSPVKSGTPCSNSDPSSRRWAHPQVTNRISSALRKGLRDLPQERFDNMNQIIEILLPEIRSKFPYEIVLSFACIVAVWSLSVIIPSDKNPPCPLTSYSLREFWSEAIQEKVRTNFLVTGIPHAQREFEELFFKIDRFSRAWHYKHLKLFENNLDGRLNADIKNLEHCLDDAGYSIKSATEYVAWSMFKIVTLPHFELKLDRCLVIIGMNGIDAAYRN